jgi:hypothetical protein
MTPEMTLFLLVAGGVSLYISIMLITDLCKSIKFAYKEVIRRRKERRELISELRYNRVCNMLEASAKANACPFCKLNWDDCECEMMKIK